MKTTARLFVISACAAVMASAVASNSNSKSFAGSAFASFTADQAFEGRFAFIQNCAECHGGDLGGQFGPALSGPHSNIPWQTPLALWSYMVQQMPVGNAGSLPQQDYLNIEAFILQSNGRRPGREKLTLRAIRRDSTTLDAAH